ncbi:hypothetical protein BC835DRAFT_730634 [Cytidiella melzeri]|nr:hypothetical protein BC835DRAFT_730634 [Cytidiella melzeri]
MRAQTLTLPSSSRLYTHRVSRTARTGRTGMALSFVVPEAEWARTRSWAELKARGATIRCLRRSRRSRLRGAARSRSTCLSLSVDARRNQLPLERLVVCKHMLRSEGGGGYIMSESKLRQNTV